MRIKKYIENICEIFAKCFEMCYRLVMSAKHDNFKRISDNRLKRILDSISSLKNFTNTSFYEYTDEEIEALLDAIQSELDETREAFNKQKGKTKRVRL